MDFEGRLDLSAATRDRDALRRRYEEVVGSSAELDAFVELNAAEVRVRMDRYLSWSEDSPLGGETNPAEEELDAYVWALR